MAIKKFSSEFSNRGTVKVTDNLMIKNIDTGAVEYCTVAELLTALTSNKVSIQPLTNVAQLRLVQDNDPSGYNDIFRDSTTGAFKIIDWNGSFISFLNGKLSVGTNTPTSTLHIIGLVEYADNAAALTAGLTAGAFYRTGDLLKVVH